MLLKIRTTALRAGIRRAACLVVPTLAFFGVIACCPDEQSETCMTLEAWSMADMCTNFPAPREGEQCPPADAVARSCGSEVGPSRVDGDKCCYQTQVQCI